MTQSIVKSGYDYTRLIPKSQDVVKQKAREISDRIGRASQNIVEIGQRLLDVKDMLPHGEFTKWLADEFSWTDRTARNMMAVARTFKTETVSVLDIKPSALYMLASNEVTDEMRGEILGGNHEKPVKTADVKRVIAEKKEQPVRRVIAKEPEPVLEPEVTKNTRTSSTANHHLTDEVPAHVRRAFDTDSLCDDAAEILRRLTGVIHALCGDGKDRQPSACAALLMPERQAMEEHVAKLRRWIRFGRPAQVCPYCCGKGKGCDGCKGCGFVGEDGFAKAPKELQAKVRGWVK